MIQSVTHMYKSIFFGAIVACVFLFPQSASADTCSCDLTFKRVMKASIVDGAGGGNICERNITFSQPAGRHYSTLYSNIDTWWNNTTKIGTSPEGTSLVCRIGTATRRGAAGGPIYTEDFPGAPEPDTEITEESCNSLSHSGESAISGARLVQEYQISCEYLVELDAPPDVVEAEEDAYEPTNFSLPDTSALNPLPRGTTLPILMGRILRTFTGIFGSIALLMVIYGGITIMVSRSKGEEVKKGANIVLWASLGLIAMMSSYALVQFVFSAIGA